jgi:hypothetical protein
LAKLPYRAVVMSDNPRPCYCRYNLFSVILSLAANLRLQYGQVQFEVKLKRNQLSRFETSRKPFR